MARFLEACDEDIRSGQQNSFGISVRQYRDRYPDRQYHKAILRLTTRAHTGLMKRSKKPLNNDDAVIVTILGMVIMNPHISQRQISRKLNVFPATI